MKRILEISGEVEKALVAVFDAALKQSGFSMQATIQSIISSIQSIDSPPPIDAPK